MRSSERNDGTEKQKAFGKAFEAMEEWRDELKAVNRRHNEKVIKKLAKAAESAGWPETIVEASKEQLMQASNVQMDIIDNMVEAWGDQLDAAADGARPPTAPMMASLMPAANFLPTNPDEYRKLVMAPTEIWMEAVTAWQKNWTQAMTMWLGQVGGGGRRNGDGNTRWQ